MIKRDIFFNINGKLYFSLAHKEQDIDLTLDVAKEALKQVEMGVDG